MGPSAVDTATGHTSAGGLRVTPTTLVAASGWLGYPSHCADRRNHWIPPQSIFTAVSLVVGIPARGTGNWSSGEPGRIDRVAFSQRRSGTSWNCAAWRLYHGTHGQSALAGVPSAAGLALRSAGMDHFRRRMGREVIRAANLAVDIHLRAVSPVLGPLPLT